MHSTILWASPNVQQLGRVLVNPCTDPAPTRDLPRSSEKTGFDCHVQGGERGLPQCRQQTWCYRPLWWDWHTCFAGQIQELRAIDCQSKWTLQTSYGGTYSHIRPRRRANSSRRRTQDTRTRDQTLPQSGWFDFLVEWSRVFHWKWGWAVFAGVWFARRLLSKSVSPALDWKTAPKVLPNVLPVRTRDPQPVLQWTDLAWVSPSGRCIAQSGGHCRQSTKGIQN